MRPGPGVQFPHRVISFAFLHVPGLHPRVSPACLKMLPPILQSELLVIKGGQWERWVRIREAPTLAQSTDSELFGSREWK